MDYNDTTTNPGKLGMKQELKFSLGSLNLTYISLVQKNFKLVVLKLS